MGPLGVKTEYVYEYVSPRNIKVRILIKVRIAPL